MIPRTLVLFPAVLLCLALLLAPAAAAQTIWIDPVNGRDSNTGASPESALATLGAALDRIPRNTPLAESYRLMLRPGQYPESALPANGYIEGIRGTEGNPVTIEAAEGRHTAILHGNLDLQKSSYVSLVNLDFVTDRGRGGGGNVLHLASDDHILLRGCTLDGFDGQVRQPQETLKANQVRALAVEDCDIGGADWYALDFVAVHGGHITGSRIHDAGEFALLVKGGSADLRIEGNEIFKGRTGGISAGSGTGFDYFVSPYLHYDLYDTRIVNNIIRDNGIAVSVNGGYNILVAHNTLYNNQRFLEVMHGRRGCEGDGSVCRANLRAGGWGTTGGEEEYIPSANVFVFNNLLYNPRGAGSMDQIVTVQGPVTPPAGSNVPSPSLADRNLRIQGNVIWAGGTDLPVLNEGGGCRLENTACNEQQIRADNTLNGAEPRLAAAPASGNFAPEPSGNSPGSACRPIPVFPDTDRPSAPPLPAADPDTSVVRDYYGTPRGSTCTVGAVLPGSGGTRVPTPPRTYATAAASSGAGVPATTPAAPLPAALALAGAGGGLLALRIRYGRRP